MKPFDISLPLNYMERQALINGNFDVWQRGTSGAQPGATYVADRWRIAGGSGIPSITHQRIGLLGYEIEDAIYAYRMTVNATSTTVDYCGILQRIENGIRWLAASPQRKVTLSFWVRTNITTKKIIPALELSYGSGGSPTSVEIIKGTPVSAYNVNGWTKITQTFTLPDMKNKVVGTNYDDYMQVWLFTAMNTSIAASYSTDNTVNEQFTTTGNIDIAQVQLNEGDVALPFSPKSYGQELLDCMRYYYRSNEGVNVYGSCGGIAYSANGISTNIKYAIPMRGIPTLTISRNGVVNKLRRTDTGTDITITTPTTVGQTTKGFGALYDNGGSPFTTGCSYDFDITADAEI